MRIEDRLAAYDWAAVERSLAERGYARLPGLLTPDECAGVAALHGDAGRFRSRIDMARYRFGVGEYGYFAQPLPPIVQALRTHAYTPLSAVANRWMAALGGRERFPGDLETFLARCRARGQRQPTPLLLRYEAGGYNCLHQDLYGDVAFPLQIAIVLSRRDVDYEGGEFLLVEQRPRAQSRGEAIAVDQGEGIVFTTRYRPAQGARGAYRVSVRHGVSTIRRGVRFTLGIIFHDGK
ncbi:MAG TPA: 2OG-Fe(II) oxygenase [Thermodesulfobacteriota bacterium]